MPAYCFPTIGRYNVRITVSLAYTINTPLDILVVFVYDNSKISKSLGSFTMLFFFSIRRKVDRLKILREMQHRVPRFTSTLDNHIINYSVWRFGLLHTLKPLCPR